MLQGLSFKAKAGEQSGRLEDIAVDNGNGTHFDARQGEQNRLRCSTGADDNNILTRKRDIGNRRKEAASIGIGTKKITVFGPRYGVHRAD